MSKFIGHLFTVLSLSYSGSDSQDLQLPFLSTPILDDVFNAGVNPGAMMKEQIHFAKTQGEHMWVFQNISYLDSTF